MRAALAAYLDSPTIPRIAAVVSLILGLTFVFVWAPHPWSWQGIDQYHELARALARGEPFGTTDVPWGYGYFVAFFYAIFGERAWLPVTAQVIANATVPLMLYHLARRFTDRRTSAVAALLVSVFSFNTIYASTQASDSICTVLFLASLSCFARAHERQSLGLFMVSGLLAGLVPQFRPNMILFPPLLAAAYVLLVRRSFRAVTQMAVLLVLMALALSPWIVRNYRLTGTFLPTSTHGGVQLWYGTLQVGPYLESRAYNPRSLFESPTFDYTSIADQPILISAAYLNCPSWRGADIALVYWTDREAEPSRLAPAQTAEGAFTFSLPAPGAPTTIYYYFDASWPADAGQPRTRQTTPPDGAADPFIFFVSDDHLGDLDRRGDLLDVFDLVRMMRHLAWRDPFAGPAPLDASGDGTIDERDLGVAVVRLLGDGATSTVLAEDRFFVSSPQAATLRLSDGSSLRVPRAFGGRVTDLDVQGTLAGTLVSSRRTFTSLSAEPRRHLDPCRVVGPLAINGAFYRKEPHLMRRYMALAFDNIGREPWAFLAASAYRMGRLFVIRGTDDRMTTQQFAGSSLVYRAGFLLSIGYLLVFLCGVATALRRRSPLRVFLLPIVYVPLTICFVLTNMRYTITVQPLMFTFVALAIVVLLRLEPNEAPAGTAAAGSASVRRG
jgi:hypothetical protein